MMKNKTQDSVKQSVGKKEEELRSKIEQLAIDIDKVEDEKLEIVNQLKRSLADYQNLEANTQKRLSQLYMQSRKSLAEKLIPVVDDLTMAIKSKEGINFGQQGLAWVNGVQGMLNNLEKALGEIGLEKYIPEINSTFDANLHEAITTVPGKVGNLIHDVIQPGYILDDIVIRPSRVVVTKNN
jgi:molecular chaperone GrpE